MQPRALALRCLGRVVLLAVGAAGAACAPHGPGAAGRTPAIARPLAAHPIDKLRARPAPLAAPETYAWGDRLRLRLDLERHLRDLQRQVAVLRNGLRTGSGPAPRESLAAIRAREDELTASLLQLEAATAASWPRVRKEALEAVGRFGRAVERARLSASPGVTPVITM
ncbi:MAG TPA: hypothetical protein VFU46_11270 [Gemmatimonadales bacterium]|nr:hypothetical protein [Gemmatimonadales bacterium]